MGAHDRTPARASPTPASTCASPSSRPARPRRRCGCSPSRRRPRSAPTSSPTCAGRRCSTTSSSPRPRSARWPRRPGRSSARVASGSRSTRPTCTPPPSALAERGRHHPAHRRRHAAPRARARGLAPRRRHHRRRWRLGRRAARRRVRPVRANRPRAPKGFDGELRSYQAEALAWLGFLDAGGIGGCLALDMGLGKTPTMLAHLLAAADRGPALVIAPPAVVGNWAAEAARFTPGLRVIVHHGPGRAAHDEIADEVEKADVVITTYGTAVRDIDAIAKVEWATVVTRRGAGDQEPHQRDRAAAAPDQRADAGRAHRHADRERPRRPVGHPRLHQPGPGRPAAAVHRQPLRRRERRRRGGWCRRARRGRGRAARAQRHPRVPPHQDRAGDPGRAARQDRPARPLRDDRRADRPLPGGARPAGARQRPARGRGAAQGPDPRRHHRAQADLQPPRRLPGRRRAARRSRRASWRGSRRSSTRCSRPASGCWCSPTSPSGA